MANRKTRKKKKASGKRGRKIPRSLLMLVLLSGAVLTGALLYSFFQHQSSNVPEQVIDVIGDIDSPPITYEEAGGHVKPVVIDTHGKKDHPKGDDRKEKRKARPRIAIVIDDMGYQNKTCNQLIDLDLDISFAFLPFGPYVKDQAYKAHRLGRDVLLHFPMEAIGKQWDPGPGTITIDMGRREIRRVLAANMARVPFAVGINNHMGSRFTQNDKSVRIFMDLIRNDEMFFLDSRTSENSVGFAIAREMGIKTAKRNVFLDNVRDRQKIKVQLRKLLDIAGKQGSAIAIGHPYPETFMALQDLRQELSNKAKVVGVSKLVR